MLRISRRSPPARQYSTSYQDEILNALLPNVILGASKFAKRYFAKTEITQIRGMSRSLLK
jgi:hypothetical protein